MPSSSDFYNRLVDANDKLDGANGRLDTANAHLGTIEGKLDAIVHAVQTATNAVHQVNHTLQTGFARLITIGNYTNQALYQNAQQNDTMICALENISRNTCALLNEAHMQTELQKSIKDSATTLADLYAATHGEAAVARERLEELRRQVEECCPPKVPPPPCQYQACPKHFGRLEEPPKVSPGSDGQKPIG